MIKIRRFIPFRSASFEKIDTGKCPFPSQAFFLLNNRCNARCTMCMIGDYFKDKPNRITLDKFKVIVENIRLEKLEAIILSGGEPLLNDDVFDIVGFVNQHYPHIMVNITTNAIALNSEKARELVKRDVNLLSISLNAGTKETYKRVMQVDCFERVLENIKYYQELCSKANKQANIWLSFVAHRKNIEDLVKFVELGDALKVKLLTTSYCRFYPKSRRLTLAASRENLLDDSDSLFFHRDLSNRYFREAEELSARLRMEFRREPLFCEKFARVKCKFPFTSILVGVDGEVFPCCGGEVIFKEKVRSGEYNFGDLSKEGIENFWNNDHYRAVRYSALNPDNPAVAECSVCSQALMWNGHVQKSHILEWDGLADKSIQFEVIQSKKPKRWGLI